MSEKNNKSNLKFPATLLYPVEMFLRRKLSQLENNRKKIDEEDPFKDVGRVTDNAAPDTEADEQFGHARVSAIRYQLDRKIIQTRLALTRVKVGKYGICENCGKMIDTDRLMIYPEATLCVDCEAKKEK